MKFRNIITSVLAIATIAAGSLQFPASLTTHAAADGGFSEAQIEASPHQAYSFGKQDRCKIS
ncbi:MAG: hypothetical protein KBA55_14840 [Ruminococcus sp.]|nr:hypothetical protein [Ruminococcus sp.]